MKILILGATGMLGFAFAKYFDGQNGYDLSVFVRKGKEDVIKRYLSSGVRIYSAESIFYPQNVLNSIVLECLPDVVINCIGIVKHDIDCYPVDEVILVNSVLPHRLSNFAKEYSFKLIHFSTDCVFSGKRGYYSESDSPDAEDLYGRTKILGEVVGSNCLTIRTSIIGRELFSKKGLIEWFLNQAGKVPGYTHAVFSGFPANVIADLVGKYLLFSDLSGIVHLSSYPISKYDLLSKVKTIYGRDDIELERHEEPKIDRSLDSSYFKSFFNYMPEPWDELLLSMKEFYGNFFLEEKNVT